MMPQLFMSLLICLFSALLLPAQAQASPTRVDATVLDLISPNTAVAPGQSFEVGLHFRLDPHWHTYWKNPGDTGLPAVVDWVLPQGVQVKALQWPVPEKIILDPLVSYAYEDEVLLKQEVTVPENFPVGAMLNLGAKVTWLMCADVCLPGEASFSLQIPVKEQAKIDAGVASFFQQVNLPKETLKSRADLTGRYYFLEVEKKASGGHLLEKAVFIPDDEDLIKDLAPQSVDVEKGLKFRIERDSYYNHQPEILSGLLRLEDGTAYRVAAPVTVSEGMPEFVEKLAQPQQVAVPITFALAILFAVLGGVILNLMPCVLPVLSLKVMSLVHHAHGRHVWQHAFVFVLGIFVSFWMLAGGLIALQAAGAELGWGFHLQSPAFVAILVLLLVLVALELFGVYEVGTSFAQLENKLGHKEGLIGSFLTGALMTIVATPCTVPFMGGAVAYSLSQPALVTLAVFTALGVGLALPYLVFALIPGLLKHIPKPGAWMEKFRKILGIPMLLTAVWLAWVFYQQTLPLASLILLVFIAFTGFGAWVYGRYGRMQVEDKKRRLALGFFLITIVISGYFSTCFKIDETRKAVAEGAWQVWSPALEQRLRSEGRPVLINFTADWCITCKFNERLVLKTDEAKRLFKLYNVALLKADWTRRDDAITRALDSYGRKGVPLYVYYPQDSHEPVIFQQILTTSALRDTFVKK